MDRQVWNHHFCGVLWLQFNFQFHPCFSGLFIAHSGAVLFSGSRQSSSFVFLNEATLCRRSLWSLFFLCKKKKSKHVSISLPTWDHMGLECWFSLKCFPLFLNKGLVRSSGVACSPFGGGSFDNIIYVNVCGRVTEDGQNIYNSWVKSLIKICYDVTSLGPLSICSVSSP